MNAPANSGGDRDHGGDQERADHVATLNEDMANDVDGDSSSSYIAVQLNEIEQELSSSHAGHKRPK